MSQEADYGTPYTTSEARMAADDNTMDLYHRDLILWLCSRVEELEKQIKDKSP